MLDRRVLLTGAGAFALIAALRWLQTGEVEAADAFEIQKSDIVFADDDGCVFIDDDSAPAVLESAREIWQRERAQADAIHSGKLLRSQLQFADYLTQRATDPAYTFRRHLRKLGGAIEE